MDKGAPNGAHADGHMQLNENEFATPRGPDQSIPILDLSWASIPSKKPLLLDQLRAALFDVGFLYVINHGVCLPAIHHLADQLPALFRLPDDEKAAMSKLNSPHFLGYSGFAEETTLGKQDLREQFDFATELQPVWTDPNSLPVTPKASPASNDSRSIKVSPREQMPLNRDLTQIYWRLRGPNQWPSSKSLPNFRTAFGDYHDAVESLSYRFVHLVEEAFDIPVGTFDHFFAPRTTTAGIEEEGEDWIDPADWSGMREIRECLVPQHRIKLVRYPSPTGKDGGGQGVGAHKDSSGWLTFLYQCGSEPGLEVLGFSGSWIKAKPIENSFVVNFGNAFEAATEGAVKATVHRVIAPAVGAPERYSIPFFMGLPLDMSVSEIRGYIPEHVRTMRKRHGNATKEVSAFLDPRWDSLGESQLRKWIRSHKDVGLKWYGEEAVDYYTR